MSNRNNTFAVTVIGRDGRCRICDRLDQLQAHHIVPISEGGADIPENGIALCVDCHADQHPDVPRELFLTQVEGVAKKDKWNATTLAAKFRCCQRTITRAAKALQLTMYGSRWAFSDEEAKLIYHRTRSGRNDLESAQRRNKAKEALTNLKRQLNVKASELLLKEIEALQEKFNMGKGEIVALAVDRLYQQEVETNREIDKKEAP